MLKRIDKLRYAWNSVVSAQSKISIGLTTTEAFLSRRDQKALVKEQAEAFRALEKLEMKINSMIDEEKK